MSIRSLQPIENLQREALNPMELACIPFDFFQTRHGASPETKSSTLLCF
jgi:hypothetical protein